MNIDPIKTDGDYRRTLAEIETLMTAGRDTPEGDRLDVLVTLVEAWEARHHPLDLPDPVAAILYHMEQGGLAPKDLIPYIDARSLAGIEADAYERGRADAKKELLDLLQPGGGRSGARAGRGKAAGRKASNGKQASRGKRAPRGSVRPFVERVLREHPGAAVSEIPGHAAGDVERSIKLSSIRVELRNGRLRGRYVSDRGRWSLAASEASSPASEGAAPSEPPPGSVPVAGEADGGALPVAGETAAPAEGEGGSGAMLGVKF